MADRYERIETFESFKMWDTNCSLILNKYALSMDKRSGSLFLQFQWENISSDSIKGFEIKVVCKDYGNEILEEVVHAYLDLHLSTNNMVGDLVPVWLTNKKSRVFELFVTKIYYQNGNIDESVYLLREIARGEDVSRLGELQSTYIRELQKSNNFCKAVVCPSFFDTYWLCTCNTLNTATMCRKCGMKKDVLEQLFSREYLYEKEKEHIEECKLKQRENELHKKEIQRKVKKMCLFAISIILIVSFCSVLYKFVYVPNRVKNGAVVLINERKYQEAYSLLNEANIEAEPIFKEEMNKLFENKDYLEVVHLSEFLENSERENALLVYAEELYMQGDVENAIVLLENVDLEKKTDLLKKNPELAIDMGIKSIADNDEKKAREYFGLISNFEELLVERRNDLLDGLRLSANNWGDMTLWQKYLFVVDGKFSPDVQKIVSESYYNQAIAEVEDPLRFVSLSNMITDKEYLEKVGEEGKIRLEENLKKGLTNRAETYLQTNGITGVEEYQKVIEFKNRVLNEGIDLFDIKKYDNGEINKEFLTQDDIGVLDYASKNYKSLIGAWEGCSEYSYGYYIYVNDYQIIRGNSNRKRKIKVHCGKRYGFNWLDDNGNSVAVWGDDLLVIGPNCYQRTNSTSLPENLKTAY